MPSQWKIEHWPKCGFHIFLSHCAEDRDRLVLPVRDELEKRGISTWIDRHNYPLGRNPFEVLREELLRCRHIVFIVTPAAVKQGRGWTAVEKAYGAVIQNEFQFRGEVAHFELPLYFVPRDNERYRRSIWSTIENRGEFYDGSPTAYRKMTRWAVERIAEFVSNEQVWAADIAERIEGDAELSAVYKREANLYHRIIAADPPAIAPVTP